MFTAPLKRLRQKAWLETIPDTIDVPAIGAQIARTVPVDKATLDEIDFALVALGRQRSDLCRLMGALEDVVRMARRQGAAGADNAVSAAVRDLEASR